MVREQVDFRISINPCDTVNEESEAALDEISGSTVGIRIAWSSGTGSELSSPSWLSLRCRC